MMHSRYVPYALGRRFQRLKCPECVVFGKCQNKMWSFIAGIFSPLILSSFRPRSDRKLHSLKQVYFSFVGFYRINLIITHYTSFSKVLNNFEEN